METIVETTWEIRLLKKVTEICSTDPVFGSLVTPRVFLRLVEVEGYMVEGSV